LGCFSLISWYKKDLVTFFPGEKNQN
jgi:hypothetical protein